MENPHWQTAWIFAIHIRYLLIVSNIPIHFQKAIFSNILFKKYGNFLSRLFLSRILVYTGYKFFTKKINM